jgi:hypothetical protein
LRIILAQSTHASGWNIGNIFERVHIKRNNESNSNHADPEGLLIKKRQQMIEIAPIFVQGRAVPIIGMKIGKLLELFVS